MVAERPVTVTLVACLYLLLGIVTLAAGIWLVFGDHMLWGPITLAAAAIISVLTAGFFMGWSVMWYLGIIMSVLGIISGLLMLFIPIVNVLGAISVLANILIIVYLFRPHVKDFVLED